MSQGKVTDDDDSRQAGKVMMSAKGNDDIKTASISTGDEIKQTGNEEDNVTNSGEGGGGGGRVQIANMEIMTGDDATDWRDHIRKHPGEKKHLRIFALGCQLNQSKQRPTKLDCMWRTIQLMADWQDETAEDIVAKLNQLFGMVGKPDLMKTRSEFLCGKQRKGGYNALFGRFLEKMDELEIEYI